MSSRMRQARASPRRHDRETVPSWQRLSPPRVPLAARLTPYQSGDHGIVCGLASSRHVAGLGDMRFFRRKIKDLPKDNSSHRQTVLAPSAFDARAGRVLRYDDYLFMADDEAMIASTVMIDLDRGAHAVQVHGTFSSPLDGRGATITLLDGGTDTIIRTQTLVPVVGQGGDGVLLTTIVCPTQIKNARLLLRTYPGCTFRLDRVSLSSVEYQSEFAIVNKSYRKDLEWSVCLYRSFSRFQQQYIPFYIVVPCDDISLFSYKFASEFTQGKISSQPLLLTEEEIFEICSITIPRSFSGWHTQQIIKLCFSKLRLARSYLTLDSSMIFTKRLIMSRFYDRSHLVTSALPIKKSDFFSYLVESGENGWLDGGLVNISRSFERISSFMQNKTDATNSYISCTGIFNSKLCLALEDYSRERNIDGFVGLIEMAPYEFAWYGEFVYAQQNSHFHARDPHLMTLIHSPEDALAVRSGTRSSEPHHFGLMFQPPASEQCDPEELFRLLSEGILR